MSRPARVEHRSRVAAPLARVWAHASNMVGVNRELMPLVRMTYPRAAASLADAAAVPLDVVLFRSVLLLFGFVPIDLHMLRLRALDPPHGFDEDSYSWLQRSWRHHRRLTALGEHATEIHDLVEFEPRLGGAWLLQPIVGRVFAHRHAVLRERFGEAREG